ncbi:PucR C-terminal helix-turn-helix domain-containing protein [Clostridium magnum DSM 2767]|nr:PucR C-terminal helix-turn-helix domain-containing protein [Clostridium magnum DSM 2767]
MLALIYNKQDSVALLEGYAKKSGISYNAPTNIFIVELNFEEASEKIELEILNRIIRLLEGTFKGSIAAAINEKTIVLLHKYLYSNNKTTDYKEKLTEVNEKIYDKIGINVKISTGKTADNLYDAHKSFEIANETLLFGKKVFPSDSVYVFDLLKSEMIFSQNSTKWKIDELENTYKLIESSDKNGELRETLEALIEENGELNNVSNKLFIHRNTLSYRLNKIHKLTNKNPRKYTDLFWLYSAMINIQK